eukprot:1006801-Pleurochrysis_carterae.AAC.1
MRTCRRRAVWRAWWWRRRPGRPRRQERGRAWGGWSRRRPAGLSGGAATALAAARLWPARPGWHAGLVARGHDDCVGAAAPQVVKDLLLVLAVRLELGLGLPVDVARRLSEDENMQHGGVDLLRLVNVHVQPALPRRDD